MVWSYFKGPIAGADPWDAWTLEWSTTSPPPHYNFAVIPEPSKVAVLSGILSIPKILTAITNKHERRIQR